MKKIKTKKKTIACPTTTDGCCVHLATWQFGVAWGVAFGAGLFFLGILAWLFGWGMDAVGVVGSFYGGYDASFFGALLGGVWGFVDGMIGGFLIASVYNWLWRA